MKILIADDHELFLKGLEMVLSDFSSEAELVKARNYSEIFAIIEKQKDFNLVLTDLAMPGARWLEALQRIHEQLPDTPVIILSAVFDREIVQKTIELGAAGYIPKTSSNAVILSAVNLVLSGGVYIPAELLQGMSRDEFDMLKQLENVSEEQNLAEKVKILTPRQIEVLRLIAEGKSNKQIAYEMGVSEATVKLHINALLRAVGATNRTQAVIIAQKMGLI